MQRIALGIHTGAATRIIGAAIGDAATVFAYLTAAAGAIAGIAMGGIALGVDAGSAT